MAKGSIYTIPYLEYNSSHTPVTPGTYLVKVLRGKAAQYGARYEAALLKDLYRLRDAGVVEPVRSARGSVAYRLREGQELPPR
jgi:hypothetical protein